MTDKKTLQIAVAAGHFALTTRHPAQIAQALNVSTRTITRWAETQTWKDTLTAIGYTGELSFQTAPTRNAKRDSESIYKHAHDRYTELINSEDIPSHKVCSTVAKDVGTDPRTIRRWAKSDKW